ncbi:MAG: tRNA-dihydrouridine synthase, partial [Christensenellaceae bacterium]
MNKKIFLAPLAGITDSAMREVCIDCGAQMTYTEMISAKG